MTGAVTFGLIRLLAPNASRSVSGWLPTGDRGVDRSIVGQTERRGTILAALALAAVAEMASAEPSVALLVLGGAAAVAYRLLPGPTGAHLGAAGALGALATLDGPTCADLDGSRRPVAVLLMVGGLGLFAVLRVMFAGAGFALGDAGGVALAAFGIVVLGAFVAGPFGTDLAELVGVGGGATAVVAVFGAIVVGAAMLPSFAASIIGVVLLAATLSADAVVGGSCDARRGMTLTVLGGFLAVWWIAGRWTSRT